MPELDPNTMIILGELRESKRATEENHKTIFKKLDHVNDRLTKLEAAHTSRLNALEEEAGGHKTAIEELQTVKNKAIGAGTAAGTIVGLIGWLANFFHSGS